jgi:hypothetical protein
LRPKLYINFLEFLFMKARYQIIIIQLLNMGFFFSTILAFAAQASNYIFLGQQPLTMVSDNGEFSSFELGHYDETLKRYVIDNLLNRRIETLWHYRDDGKPLQISANIEKGYIGCDEGLVVNTGDRQAGLLSSKRLSVGWPSSTQKSRVEEGRRLLASTLRKYKLSDQVIVRMIEKAEVTLVEIGWNKKYALVVTATDETHKQTAMAFLIATSDDHGGYLISREDVRTGGASDSEGYAGAVELFLHSDLDGDGAEEILIRHSAYETFGAYLLRWDGISWQEISSISGGC